MCSKIKNYINYIEEILKDNLPCLIIVVSFILLTPEACFKFELFVPRNEIIKNGVSFLSYVGSTMLVTGVYGVFSKTLFFNGIYSNMISDVFYGTDNLKRKSEQELESIWRRVSECMYKSRRFSEINEAVEKHVLSSYLPSEQPYYFKNNKSVIDYVWDEENPRYIIVTEDVYFSVVGIESEYSGKIHRFTSHIDKSKTDKISSVEILIYEVDGKAISLPESNQMTNKSGEDIWLSCSTDVTETSITKVYTLYVDNNNSPKYSIHCKIQQKVELSLNKLKKSVCKRIVDGWDITMRYPKDLKVDFIEVGLLKDFDIVCDNKGLMCRKYEDLIFPYQGYILFVDTFSS